MIKNNENAPLNLIGISGKQRYPTGTPGWGEDLVDTGIRAWSEQSQ